MNIQNNLDRVLNKFPKDKVQLESQKVELGLADDFEKKFNKVNDEDVKIGKQLIDNLRKAEVKYSQQSKDYQELIKQGEKLESSAKELGIDLPVIIKNKILSSKEGVKETQKLNQAITKMYSIF
jgi:hypothetical protein